MSGELYLQINSSGRINSLFRRDKINPAERGQTMVEIALVLPIFLVFIFAIMEMGRAWSAKQALTISAREGARILSMPYGLEPAYRYKTESEAIRAAEEAVEASMNGSGTPAIKSLTTITPVRIRPGIDGVFNTKDDVTEHYFPGISPPVLRGDRVGFFISYKFETPAPILLRMYDNGGDSPGQGEINMSVMCIMDHE